MNLITITTDPNDDNYIIVDFGQSQHHWAWVRVKRNTARAVGRVRNDEAVEILFIDGSNIQLQFENVDDVNGTNPQSNVELCDLIAPLMKV